MPALRVLLLAVLIAACGGVEESESHLAPVSHHVDDHGPIGDPSDAIGCQRDFCPTANVEHVGLHVAGDVRECFCWCSGFNTPAASWLAFTQNPWPAASLTWAQNEWATFCPHPE